MREIPWITLKLELRESFSIESSFETYFANEFVSVTIMFAKVLINKFT